MCMIRRGGSSNNKKMGQIKTRSSMMSKQMNPKQKLMFNLKRRREARLTVAEVHISFVFFVFIDFTFSASENVVMHGKIDFLNIQGVIWFVSILFLIV